MKNNRLGILVCDSFRHEMTALQQSLAPSDADFLIFAACCGRPPLGWQELERLLPEPGVYSKIIALGSCCCGQLQSAPETFQHLSLVRLPHCFSLICDDYAVTRYQATGAYLVSSGWLAHWEERIAALGFDAGGIRCFLAESVSRIIHLDTGILPDAGQRLDSMGRYLGLPVQTVPVGIGFLRLTVERLIADWREGRRRDEATKALRASQKKSADYAMTLDLLKLIVQTTGREAVAREILNLYASIFAANDAAYLPWVHGRPGPVTRIGSVAACTDAAFQEEAAHLDADYRLLTSGDGFLLRVIHDDTILGVIRIGGITFPGNMEQYLHLALETVVVCAVVLNNANNFERLVSMSEQLRLSEEALREREQMYHAMFVESRLVKLLLDPRDGSIVDANPAAVAFYGYQEAQLKAMTLSSLVPAIADQVQQGTWSPLQRSGLKSRHRVASGDHREVEVHWSLVRVGGRTLLHAIIHDVTDQLRAESEKRDLEHRLQLAQKAQSLGRMAGAIAHRFNNLLGVVIGNLDMAQLRCAGDAPVQMFLDEAQKAANQAAEVSKLMLTYLGQAPGKHNEIDLAEVCRRAVDGVQDGLPAKVTLEVDIPAAGPLVRGNEPQLNQALNNLLANAWESLPGERGRVSFSLREVAAENLPGAQRFPVEWQPEPGVLYACVEVKDEGSGIEEGDLNELFDPFFTSKFPGRGLGLPVVLGIVRAHGGAVAIESRIGQGSAFRIYLPQLEGALPKNSEMPPATKVEGAGTVLLVDDEAAVRLTAKSLLNAMGFAVLQAADGVEALKIFKEQGPSIRCVLSDLTMPRMNGWETLAALRSIAPDVVVILASGYDQDQVMAGEHPELPQAFLQKPYGLQGLREAMSAALGGSTTQMEGARRDN